MNSSHDRFQAVWDWHRVAVRAIDVLTLIGEDVTKNLHAVRKWRDWVAHRKAGARPAAVDLEMAQSLLIAALTRLEMCPIGQAKALS